MFTLEANYNRINFNVLLQYAVGFQLFSKMILQKITLQNSV